MAEIILTAENFEEEVLKSELPVLVDFWATWCGPCRMLAPTVEALANECDGRFKVGKVNVDDCTELAIRYRVDVIPTVLLFKNGEVTEKLVGVQPKSAYEALLG